MNGYDITKYYVWKNNDHADADGFWDMEEAITFAKENDCDEVEMTCWENEDSYDNREPADYFKTVWRK